MQKLIIQTKDLTKIYGEQTVADRVNLHIRQGKIYGLLGRKGAGKTTIMKMMMGLTRITKGEIEIFGQRVETHQKDIYPRIGAIIEAPGFYPNLTGAENLNVFARLRGTVSLDAVKEALELVGLPYNDKKLFSKYSLGMKHRLGIANAIIHDPELLILDEPTNGLDPIGIAEIRKFIRFLSEERGKTILISSHILSEIALLADDIGILHNGVLLEESSLATLQKKNECYIAFRVSSTAKAARVLEEFFGITCYVIENDHNMRVLDTSMDIAEINKAFIMNEVAVSRSDLCEETLEDYFKKITGGEGIA